MPLGMRHYLEPLIAAGEVDTRGRRLARELESLDN